jgi:hypothetical protein
MKPTSRIKTAAVVAMVPIFAGLNRLWGSDVGSARTLVITAAVAMSLTANYGLHDSMLAWLCTLWAVSRSLRFKIFGGSLTPETPVEMVGAMLRFLVPAVVTVAYRDWTATAIMVIYAAAATWVSHCYAETIEDMKANGIPEGGANVRIELGHGLLYGIALLGMQVVQLTTA